MQTEIHRGCFMFIKDFKDVSFSKEMQLDYLTKNKDTLNIEDEQLADAKLMNKCNITKFYSYLLQQLPNTPKKIGTQVNRRVSSVSNAICMEYSNVYADFDTNKGIPNKVFKERDSIFGESNGKCVYCYMNYANSHDHIIPSQNKGQCGLNNALNIILCCDTCNVNLKKNKPLDEWMDICHSKWPKHWPIKKCKALLMHINNTYRRYYYASEEFFGPISILEVKTKANVDH